MNERDTEAVRQDLTKHGYEYTDKEEDADVLLFNTCSVRDQAERKAMGKIGVVKKLIRKKPNLKVGVMGCMAQSKGAKITNKYEHVNFVVGTDKLHKIPGILDKVFQNPEPIIEIGTSREILEHLQNHPEGQVTSFVSVMRGCNEYCTYCIVPFTRGQEKSRPIASIIRQVEELVKKGVKEITFLGQNITAYGLIEARRNRTFSKKISPFAELLRETAKISEIKRIRFTSPHARYFNDDLIQTIAEEAKICRGIHFPLQSGSDRILKLMRRKHTVAEYMEWVNKIKKAIPDISFSTDIIVGFPGETDEDFNETRKICNEVEFDQEFLFKYSPRVNTPAANMPEQFSDEVKQTRHKILMDDLAIRVKKINQNLIGTKQEIMIEGPSKRNSEKWSGRNSGNKICIFSPKDSHKIGDIVEIKIDFVTGNSLYGEIV